jgi:hypothetical protein
MSQEQTINVKIVETTSENSLGIVLGNSMGQIARAGFEIASAIREAAQLYAARHGFSYPWPNRGPNNEPISYPQIERR